VKRLQRHGDLTIFKMAVVRHLGLLKFKSHLLSVGAVKGPILHHRTKFRKDRSKFCGDIATFVIFNVAAVDYMTLYRATLNRATLNQRQLIGRQLTAATFNRNDIIKQVTLHRVTLNR